jgi:hypothetical protein
MNKEEFISYSKTLIQQDRVEYLLNKFLGPIFNNIKKKKIDDDTYDLLMSHHNNFTLILARYHANKKREINDVLTRDIIDSNLSKTMVSCLYLIDQLSEIKEFLQIIPVKENSDIINNFVVHKREKKFNESFDNKKLWSKLRMLENIKETNNEQAPIIGIFEIPSENEKSELIVNLNLLDLLIGAGRIKPISKFNPEHENLDGLRFTGTNVICLENINDEKIKITIPIIQIYSNRIPHIKSLNFLNALRVIHQLPMIFVFLYDEDIEIIERQKNLLSQYGLVMETSGGPIQCQEISYKTGLGIQEFIEKVFLELEFYR